MLTVPGKGLPQLESFDKFFQMFGSGVISQPSDNPSPAASTPVHLSQLPSDQSPNLDHGKSFPTAVPYIHDPSGDGSGARQRQTGPRRSEDPQKTSSRHIQQNVPTVETVDPKSHQAALQRNALHRQQLAEVIAEHNKIVKERQEEIIKTSEEDTDNDTYENRSVNKSSKPKLRNQSQSQIDSKENKLNLKEFIKNRSKSKITNQKGLSDIQSEVVENLNLIGQLAEEIFDLDVKAYEVFSNIKNHKKKKNSKEIKKQQSKTVSIHSDEYEDSGEEDSFIKPVQNKSKSPRLANGRIRNIGLKIRQ